MNWIKKRNQTVCWGYCLLAFIYYFLICLFLYLSSAILLKQNVILSTWPFVEYQKHFYFSGYRNIWQNDINCVNTDKELIYSPKIGRCKFNNPEYKTVLTFSKEGRNNPSKIFDKNLSAIAVIGDSHAMGWGVNDESTFSNLLQSKLQKPVYNLAVSSYGTFRELKRLKLSGKLNEIDTIVIQYCSNDLKENTEMLVDADLTTKLDKFNKLLFGSDINLLKKNFKKYIKFALSTPFEGFLSFFDEEKSDDFTPHLKPLKSVIKHYGNEIKDKKIIVFYSNGHGKRFKNFPNGQDRDIKNLYFHDLNLTPSAYYTIDDHLTPYGHKEIADKLTKLILK